MVVVVGVVSVVVGVGRRIQPGMASVVFVWFGIHHVWMRTEITTIKNEITNVKFI